MENLVGTLSFSRKRFMWQKNTSMSSHFVGTNTDTLKPNLVKNGSRLSLRGIVTIRFFANLIIDLGYKKCLRRATGAVAITGRIILYSAIKKLRINKAVILKMRGISYSITRGA
jgi:hypothetical protein